MKSSIRLWVRLALWIGVIWSCLTPPVFAKVSTISVLPSHPSANSKITLRMQGYLNDPCWAVSGHALARNGNAFTVEIDEVDQSEPGFGCPQVIVPYSIDYDLGRLPAGTYAIRVVEHDPSLTSHGVKEHHVCFVVGDSRWQFRLPRQWRWFHNGKSRDDAFACDCGSSSGSRYNRATDVTDVTRVIALTFRGAEPADTPHCPWAEMDVDCSGVTDIVDVISVIDVAFRGTPASTFCNPCSP